VSWWGMGGGWGGGAVVGGAFGGIAEDGVGVGELDEAVGGGGVVGVAVGVVGFGESVEGSRGGLLVRGFSGWGVGLGGEGREEGGVLLHIAVARVGRNLERLIMILITVSSNGAGMEGEPLPAMSSGDEIRAEWHSSSRMLLPALHWRLWEGMRLLMRINPNRGFCRRHSPNENSVKFRR
jgi:hypothetical protein